MTFATSFTLNTGAKIPAVGLGTWQSVPGDVGAAVEEALKQGYRHIDCAAYYRNEREVGQGIRKSGVDRKDLFLTGKLWNNKHRPEDVEPALEKSLQDLGTDYLDLYLMHWPVAFAPGDAMNPLDDEGSFKLADIDPADTYKAMEKLLQSGKVKAIGVSNFSIRRLEDLLSKTDIVPAANQIEAHPYLQQPELLRFCQAKGILVEAYSPLGNNTIGEPRAVDDPKVFELGKELQRDPGNILCSWGVQRGTVVLPKNVTPSRIASNLNVRELPTKTVAGLDTLERHKRFHKAPWWGVDIFHEMGEERARQISRESAAVIKEKFAGW